ncbi:MAG: hotdog fold thioesterase [Desulfobacterales bacterium]|jgi:acyl-CoA thioesterase
MGDKNVERFEELRQFFGERDRFAAHNGIEILEISPGRARVRMEVAEHHLNGLDRVHGGAVFSLADLAFAAASNSHGSAAMGINASIAYVKEAAGDVLFAEAEEVSRSHRLATYSIRVTDASGQTVALFQGTVYRREGQAIPPPGWEGASFIG